MITETYILEKKCKIFQNEWSEEKSAYMYNSCVCILPLCALNISSILFQSRAEHHPYNSASSGRTGIMFIVFTSISSEGIQTKVRCVELTKAENHQGHCSSICLSKHIHTPSCIAPYQVPTGNSMPELNLSLQHLLECLDLNHPPHQPHKIYAESNP